MGGGPSWETDDEDTRAHSRRVRKISILTENALGGPARWRELKLAGLVPAALPRAATKFLSDHFFCAASSA